jgi:hypothetical protein
MAQNVRHQREGEARFEAAHRAKQRPTHGIYGPTWFTWRNSIFRVEPPDAEPYIARLLDRKGDLATLQVLDPKDANRKIVLGQRTIPWPPTDATRITVLWNANG